MTSSVEAGYWYFVKSLGFLHNGSIRIYSERHKGSSFIKGLPVSRDDYTVDEKWTQSKKESVVNIESIQYKLEDSPVSQSECSHDLKNVSHITKHILIIDYNEELRQFLKESLSPYYLVWEAEDGHAGIRTAMEKLPDFIITDVMIPGMNGIELCNELKKGRR